MLIVIRLITYKVVHLGKIFRRRELDCCRELHHICDMNTSILQRKVHTARFVEIIYINFMVKLQEFTASSSRVISFIPAPVSIMSSFSI